MVLNIRDLLGRAIAGQSGPGPGSLGAGVIDLGSLLGIGGGPLGGEGEPGPPEALQDVVGGLLGFGNARQRIKLEGKAVKGLNGKSAQQFVTELRDLMNTLEDEMAGLFATQVSAIDEAMQKAVALNLGMLKSTVDLPALLKALSAVHEKTVKLKTENTDNAKLGEFEVQVAQAIADWTSLQEFDPDVEFRTETFSIQVSGTAKEVEEVIGKLQAVVDWEKSKLPINGLDKILEHFPAGSKFAFAPSCGGLCLLAPEGTQRAHEHLDADRERLKAELSAAGLIEITIEEFAAEQVERLEAAADEEDDTDDFGVDLGGGFDDDDDSDDDDDEDFEGEEDSDVSLATSENDSGTDKEVQV